MLLSKQPGDTGIYATATSSHVRLYYVPDRVLPYAADKAAVDAGANGLAGVGGISSSGLRDPQVDEMRAARCIANAPGCVPRGYLRMLYRLTAVGSGTNGTGCVFYAAESPAATALSSYPTSQPKHSYVQGNSPATHSIECVNQRLQGEASSVCHWGSPLIPFHTVQCSAGVVSGFDSARLYSPRGNNKSCNYYSTNRPSQEWSTPTPGNAEDSGVLTGSASHFTNLTGVVLAESGGAYTGGGRGDNSGPGSVTHNGRSVNSAREVFSNPAAAAAPTTLSLSSATDCLLFFVANSEGHSWVGRSDTTALSPLHVSTLLQMGPRGNTSSGAGASPHGSHLYTAASSSPRPPLPFLAPFGVPGNTSFPAHSFARSERMATPPNTIVDDAVPARVTTAVLIDSDEDNNSTEERDDDDAAQNTDGTNASRRGSSAGALRPPSTDGLEGHPGVPTTLISLPPGRAFSRHDRVVTASGWDPRNSAILALGRQGGIVQLLDVEYLVGSAASTRCSSTTSSASTEYTAEPLNSSAKGGVRTATSGSGGYHCGRHLTRYSGADHLSYSVIQRRDMEGSVTALDWMPQSHLTVVAARRRDGLGCYAELLDLRASHDGVTYLGAPPEVFGVPVCACGTGSAAPSVLCSAERVACHPSQRYVATVGTSRMRDIVQLWDIRMATRPVAYQVYTRAGYTSLCWSSAETGVVLGTTRDGGLRVHNFKELGPRAANKMGSSSEAATGNSGRLRLADDGGGPEGGARTAYGNGSQRSRRRRNTSGGAQHPLVGTGEQEFLNERWGVISGGPADHGSNNSGNSGTEAEAEDDVLDDSGSLRSGASFDGAGTVLSSTTEGSNALVHVSVKAQSALKCHLPSRVPAAAVAWVCCPSAELSATTAAAAAKKISGGVQGEGDMTSTVPPPTRVDEGDGGSSAGHNGRRQHSVTDSKAGWDGGGGQGKVTRTHGVIECGSRTDLPQLLLLNSKNGELYTQVYNPRGSTVTLLSQSTGLVGAGPNAFIVRPSAAYKAAELEHRELLILQLERQAVLAAAIAGAARAEIRQSPILAVSTGPNGVTGSGVAALSGSLRGSTGGGSSQLHAGGGDASAVKDNDSSGSGGGVGAGSPTPTTSAAAVSTRRTMDRPVDLMGLGLLDEDDEDEEEVDETEFDDDADDGRSGGSGCEGENDPHKDMPCTHRGGRGDALARLRSDPDAVDVDASGVRKRAAAQHQQPSLSATLPATRNTKVRRQGLSYTVGAALKRSRNLNSVERGGVLATTTAGAADEPVGHHEALSPLPPAPLQSAYPAPLHAAAALAAPLWLKVPQELSYCQFERIDRVRLIWSRLHGGFSCDPIRNLRVLINEGTDREAYAAFLYGCCASMILYPSSTADAITMQGQETVENVGASSLFPLILGARRAVPGLLELLVSERRLRARLGLRETRLSAHFRLRQYRSAAMSVKANTAADAAFTTAVAGISATTTRATGTAATFTAPPPPSLPSPATMGVDPFSFAAPLLSGLLSATDRPYKGPSGFFRSSFEAAAATMRNSTAQLPPTHGSQTAPGGLQTSGSRCGEDTGDAAAAPPAATSSTGNNALLRSGTGGVSKASRASGSNAAAEQPTHVAVMGMLHQLILQSMGWLAPPSICDVDKRGGGSNDNGASGEARCGSGDVESMHTSTHRTPLRHPAEKLFVQGDGLGQQSLQEALERRVAVLVLLDRLEDAAELLSLYSTSNPLYPSIALTLSAARKQTSASLSLAAPESPGVSFWVHLMMTFVNLLMDQERRTGVSAKVTSTTAVKSRVPFKRQSSDIVAAHSSVDHDEIPAETTTRFDTLFTLSEQKAVVLRLLRGYPRLAMSDKVGLATALLLPPHYHGAHADNLVEVLQMLVLQQYRADPTPLPGSDGINSSIGTTPLSSAAVTSTSPYISPAASPLPALAAAQRRVDGRRVLPSPPLLMPTHQPVEASTPLANARSQDRPDASENFLLNGAAAWAAWGIDCFPPVSGCSLLLVAAVEGVSTDCRALQRYVDESADIQTALYYTAAFGNISSSAFCLWREAHRRQLNEQGLSMWRSQLDLQCVRLKKAREEADKDEVHEGRVEGCGNSGGVVDAAASLAFDLTDGRVDRKRTGSTTEAASTILHAAMPMPKGFSCALSTFGGEIGPAPTPSAAAMMSTQTAMMMKRTLKGFAQTTSTTTVERDRSMREAGTGGSGEWNSNGDHHRAVELRCNCGQAMHATALGKTLISPMMSTNITRRQLIPCGNPECRQWQTPMCTVCGERMEHRATELPPERFFAWCSVCLHGGHWCHLREWFSKHTKCPVENCPCHCCDNAHLTPKQLLQEEKNT